MKTKKTFIVDDDSAEFRQRSAEFETVEAQQKRAEKELQENKKRFRDLWDHAPFASHTLDTEGVITSVNRTEAEMLGYTKKEAEVRKRFEQKISGQRIPRAVNRIYVKKNGSKIYVAADDVLERDTVGK